MPLTPVDPNSFGYGGPWLDPTAARAHLRQYAVLLEKLLDRTLKAERDSMNAGAHG
ncbi:hypothetical protein [Streptomyces sp. NPDC001508]|uniref:hypothetical protein n=1 Tax=Streptomyces sp. NPDC001508 TaxID=3154656 RepID=UPI00331DE74A